MESWYVTMVLNRCPSCGEGQLFQGWMKLRETCERCGARYERWIGSWTGPVVGGYGIGAAVAVVLILLLHGMGKLVPGAEWGIALVSCAVVLATMRPVKAAWIALLYDWGWIYPDPAPGSTGIAAPPVAPPQPEPAPAEDPESVARTR